MAKKNPALVLVDEIASKLEELKSLVGGAPAAEEAAAEETPSVELPSAKEIKALDKKEVVKLGKELNIDSTDVGTIRALLVLASRFVADEDLTAEEYAKLAKGFGLEVSKKPATNKANIAEYLSAGEATEEAETDTPEETAEETEEATEEASEEATEESEEATEETAEEGEDQEEETPKPKGKKPAKKAEAEEESEESEEAAEESSEESAEESSEEASEESEESEEAEAEGPSDDELKTAIVEYNKHTKKPLKPKDVAGMREKLTDDSEVVHPMGEGYTKDGAAWASGYPLLDVEGKEYAKDRVTGKCFKYDDAGETLVQVKFKPKK